MKYLLAVLSIFMLPLAALADAPYPDARYEMRIQRTSHNYTHERQLRQEYEAWRRQRLAQERRGKRYAAQERAEAAAARKARLRRREVAYEARLAREARYERELRAENRRKAVMEREYVGEVEEQEYATRRDHIRRCMPVITAWGPQLVGRARAELFARKAWVAQVETTHNRRYADPRRAENKRYLCDRDPTTRSPQYICRFRAAPCRGAL